METETTPENSTRFVAAFETFGNICALNVLWLICCIPVFTIGASTTALYSVMLKLINKEEGPIARSFFRAFKENFKKATIAWLIVVGAIIAISGELLFAYVYDFKGFMASFYFILGIIELIILCFVLPFLFPLIAKFENSIWNTFKNSFLLAVSNPGSWVKIFLAWFMPMFICFAYPAVFVMFWYIWVILLTGLIAFGTSFTIRKVFNRIERAQEKKNEIDSKKREINDNSDSKSLSLSEKAHMNYVKK